MRLRVRLFPDEAPKVQRYGGIPYTLRSPWEVRAWLSPVYWGAEEIETLAKGFLHPVKGWRFEAELSSEVVDPDDYHILMEFIRSGETVLFYPTESFPVGFPARVIGDLMRLERSTPETIRGRVRFKGLKIYEPDDFSLPNNGNLICKQTSATYDEATGRLSVDWEPFVETGTLSVMVSYSSTSARYGPYPITKGRVVIDCPEAPTSLRWRHDVTGLIQEVSL